MMKRMYGQGCAPTFLKVTNLPVDTTETELKFFFQNKRGQGGGKIRSINLTRGCNSADALIDFISPEAVDIVLGRGSTVTFREGHLAEVNLPGEDAAHQSPAEGIKKLKLEDVEDTDQTSAAVAESMEEIRSRTIKASVVDVWKSKEFYILYLEDPSVCGQAAFSDEDLLLDCLNRKLYVKFHKKEDAESVCKQHHGVDSNFSKVEMSTFDVFETFDDKISIHGCCLKDSSKKRQFLNHVKHVTGISTVSIIQQEETRSAILQFPQEECHDIADLCWNLKAEFNGTSLMTAPVFRPKTVRVTGLPLTVDKFLLQRYMSNSKRSGGGEIANIAWQGSDAIVTFTSEQTLNSILERKDHKLEGRQFYMERYYYCLSRAAYDQAFKDSASDRHDTPDGFSSSVGHITQKNSLAESSQPNIEESIVLNRKDLVLLQHTELLKTYQDKHTLVNIAVDIVKQEIKISGVPAQVRNAAVDLLKLLRDDNVKSQYIQFSEHQLDMLVSCSVHIKINKHLQAENRIAVLDFEQAKPVIYYKASENFEDIERIVRSYLFEKVKTVSDTNAQHLLISTFGQEWLRKLSENAEKESLAKFVPANNSVVMVGSEKTVAKFNNQIDNFLQENVTSVSTIKCSAGKLNFMKRFKTEVMSEIHHMGKSRPLPVDIKEEKEGIVVKGKLEDVNIIEERLVKLRDSVCMDDFTLRFYGMKEFLNELEGQRIKSEVETKLSCCVMLPSEGASTTPEARGITPSPQRATVVNPPQLVASVHLGGCNVHFLLGDLLGLNVSAIVNPVLDVLDIANSSGLSRAIVARGGDQIQKEIRNSDLSQTVIATGSGNLGTCQAILHTKVPKSNSGAKLPIKASVSACFNVASKMGLSSLGLPLVGTAKTFGYADLAVCIQIVQAIKEHAENGETWPGEIYMCDKNMQVLTSLLDRCEVTFPEAHVEQHIKLNQATPGGGQGDSAPSQHRQAADKAVQFGSVKVNIQMGEITRSKSNVMVLALGKSLDLRKGNLAKLVLKYGGDSIQQELDDKYSFGLQAGQFAMTSGGNLACQHIFFAYLPQWKRDDQTKGRLMQTLIEEMLDEADRLSATSLAIPALGTGNLKYPSDLVASMFKNAISNFATKRASSSLMTVDIVVFHKDTEIFENFQSTFCGENSSLSGQQSTGEKSGTEDEGDNRSKGLSGAASGFFSSVKGKVMNLLHKDPDNVFTKGSVKLTVTKGDITLEQTDAIVNSIKNSMDLSSSGAVCKALLKKCGTTLQDECTNQQMVMQQTGVAETSAPGLQCKRIFHVSMDKFSNCWDKGVMEVLTQADARGVTSIAFPLLGAGAKSANVDLIQKRFLAGVESFGKSQQVQLKDIRLIIFFQDMFDHFMAKAKPKDKNARPKQKQSFKKAPLPQVSDKADVKIYAHDFQQVKEIERELVACFRRAMKEHTEQQDRIKQLTEEQVYELKLAAAEKKVQLTVRAEEGAVMMRSFFPMEMVISKLYELMVKVVESHHNELHRAATTLIVWQYKEKDDRWSNFEPRMNLEIENQYKKKVLFCEVSTSAGQKYRLDFKSMLEYSMDHRGIKGTQGIPINRVDRTKAGEALPRRWSKMGKENLKLVAVAAGSEEYNRIEAQFKQAGASPAVKAITRIQNKTLYQQFKVKMREMQLRNGIKFQNEMRLWHGTKSDSVQAINENGFNRNYCGANQTAYGEGTYFAVHSSYSVKYCTPDATGSKHMFLARVLVGKFTRSQQGMKFLPNQPNTNTPYDSGTDGSNQMYIIFHDAQSYPEYLISF